jgi:hypothetical protein
MWTTGCTDTEKTGDETGIRTPVFHSRWGYLGSMADQLSTDAPVSGISSTYRGSVRWRHGAAFRPFPRYPHPYNYGGILLLISFSTDSTKKTEDGATLDFSRGSGEANYSQQDLSGSRKRSQTALLR